jgi:tetratricopeptide (TPR) repeat protein
MEGGPLAAALGLLRADAPETIMGAPQDWPRWAVLLPHVLAATSLADQPASPAGQDVAEDTAWLLDRAATYLQVHARLADARPLAEQALAITEATLGLNHPDVAIRMGNLALIMKDLGLAGQARPLAEQAVAISEAALGPDHPYVATLLSNLGNIVSGLGLPAEARPLAERALAITEATLGPDHPDVATLLSNLALVVRDLGLADEAEGLQERARSVGQAGGSAGSGPTGGGTR